MSGGSIWTIAFWKGAGERMFWAALSAVVSVWVTLDVTNFASIPWERYGLVAIGAALVSLVKSGGVNALGVGPVGSASAVYDRPKDYGMRASDGS